MTPTHLHGKARRLWSAFVAAALFTVSGAASAVPVSLTLEYTCEFPLIGEESITAEINSDMPAEASVDEPLGPFDIDATTTVPENGRAGLKLVDSATIEGTAENESTVQTPSRDIPQTVSLTIPQTDIPDETGEFTVPATGATSVVDFNEDDAGEASIVVGGLTLDMTARLEDGSIAPAPIGEFTTDCTQVAGQDNVLHTFDIVAPTPDPAIDVEPAAVDFGDVQIGMTADETVTVSNTGGGSLGINSISIGGMDPSAFTQTNDCTALAAGESCSVTVTYAPSVEATQSATLSIDSTDPANPTETVELSGNGVPEPTPAISVSPTAVDFGEVQSGLTAEETVTVSNTGSAALTVSGINIGGADAGAFMQTNDCTTVSTGDSCSVTVTYFASGEGAQNGTLSIDSNDPENPTTGVELTGTSVLAPEPEISVDPAEVDFGTVDVGVTEEQAVTVSNVGDAGLTINAINIGGSDSGDFMQTNDCGTLPADDSCTVTVSFTPSTDGTRTATLTVESDDPDNATVEVALTGEGDSGDSTELDLIFDLEGETFIKSAGNTLPLSGTIDATLDLATGMYTADLDLDPTSGQFRVGFFTRAKAEVEFEQVEQTTGVFSGGALTANSKVFVKVPKVTAKLFFFRLPVGGGPNCRSMDPVTINMATPEGGSFSPSTGGDLTGVYDLPPLSNCGPLTDLLNHFLAGPDNTIDLSLTPADESGE